MAAIRMKTEYNAQHLAAQFVPILGAVVVAVAEDFRLTFFFFGENFNGKMKFFIREREGNNGRLKQRGTSQLTLTNIAQ